MYARDTRPIDICVDRELTDPRVIDLLREHLAGMHAHSPAESVHALDLDGLRRPEITYLTAWRDDQLLACGAIKELQASTPGQAGHGEIKSMRTTARHLRQGAARALLTELLALARQRGYARVSLETGSAPAFEPALAMYRQFGFVDCGPFADYRADPFSRFMTLALVGT